jgi:hypothetical protein
MNAASTFHGVREALIELPSVMLHVSRGEYLLHSLFVERPEPNFTFGCAHNNLIREAGKFEGHPCHLYQWTFPKAPADIVGHEPDDVYAVTMFFLGGNTYRYTVERFGAADVLLETVRDVRCSSTTPQDMWPESVRVFFA